MRRPTGTTFGTLATAVVLGISLLALMSPAAFGSHVTARPSQATHLLALASAGHAAQARPSPAVFGAPGIQVHITSNLALYSDAGTLLNWSITTQNVTFNKTYATMNVNIVDLATGHQVRNRSVALGDAVVTSFSFALTARNIWETVGSNYQFTVYAWVSNMSGNSTSAAAQVSTYVVLNAPTASLVAPSSVFPVPQGNVTVGVFYSGDFLNGANVSISEVATGTVVYLQGVFAVGPGGHGVTAAAPWQVSTAGVYNVTITVTRPFFGATSWSSNVTIAAAAGGGGGGSYVYLNTTTYVNSTTTTTSVGKVGGLQPGVAAAVFLVVGTIIGLIVALALGRMMWGGTTPAPAQAWSAKPQTECPVCHQNFANEAEMKEHQKTAHGM